MPRSESKPPQWPLKILRLLVKKDYLEEIEGDMEEIFFENLEYMTPGKAKKIYTQEVLKIIRPSLIKKLEGTQKLNFYGMFKNNIKVAFRNLIRQKEFTLINLLGLTTGMALSMLIILFLIDQDSMDEHNPRAWDTYRVITYVQDKERDRENTYGTSPFEINQLLTESQSAVDEGSQLIRSNGNIKHKDKIFGYSGLFASKNFGSFFHYKLNDGDINGALQESNQVILSSELASKLFGDQNPVNKLVTITNLGTFNVSGTIDNESIKSHFDFDLILPVEAFERQAEHKNILSDWEAGVTEIYNYIHLQPDSDPEVIVTYLTNLDSKFPEEKKSHYRFDLQRLDQINLGLIVQNELALTSPFIVPWFLGILAFILMLSASFNYMNLSIARGLKRVKEVGVRKVIGADKFQIVIQFLMEAQLVMFAALLLAYLALQLLVPIFNDLKILRDIDGAITMNFNANIEVYLSFVAFTIVVGLISGIYPALKLSGYHSLVALKGVNSSGKSPAFLFRKFLVFVQYSFSVIFIITTIILFQQANILTHTDYGFNHENLINVPLGNVNYETFRTELLKESNIKGVSAMSGVPMLSNYERVILKEKESDSENFVTTFSIDPYALDNLELELIAGRNFDKQLQSDQNQAVIINHKALATLGLENPRDALDKVIYVGDESVVDEESSKRRIIGVVQDFTFRFVFMESGPLVMDYVPEELMMASIKYNGEDEKQAVASIESVWKGFENALPFEYESYEYSISDMDAEFIELTRIIALVSVIAIVIACLGQFSMVVHHVQLKVKEIGIRKVLGADLPRLMYLLSREFLLVILLAIILATPAAWWINKAWTDAISLAPEVSLLNISLGVGIVLILALLTIFIFVKKAVHANPVDSLKYE